MTNSKTQIIKTLQGMLDSDMDRFTLHKTLINDIYELLIEPYQITIDDILSQGGKREEIYVV